MAGIGNIYRTEILWRQAIHPETPGKAIPRQTFNRIWDDAVYLLAIGVKRNAIITVDAQLGSKKRSGEKYNIFGKSNCPKCKGTVRRLEINKRRVFVCDTCQPRSSHMSWPNALGNAPTLCSNKPNAKRNAIPKDCVLAIHWFILVFGCGGRIYSRPYH